MSNRRTNRLDDLEARLTGRCGSRCSAIATWARRRCWRCSTARRRAARSRACGWRRPTRRTAEYLAEKIAQIESGQPMAGSLAETELNLRLYHGPARFDLIVKDYQGEHVTLGSEEPIQEFFADCDAVFLCLDPEGSTEPAERRRRQQEVENLLERYIERSDDAEHGPAGRAAPDQVRPRARERPRRPTGRGSATGSPSRSIRRATGRRAVRDDAACPGGACAGRGDLRGELVRAGCRAATGRRPSCTRWAWRDRSRGWRSSSRPATAPR